MNRVNNSEQANLDGTQKMTRTVDELMEDHVDFLDTCLKECMLMNSKLLKASVPTSRFTPYASIDLLCIDSS